MSLWKAREIKYNADFDGLESTENITATLLVTIITIK